MKFLICSLTLLISLQVFSQDEKWEGDTGKVELNMPFEVEALLERHKAYLEKVEGIPGYRIQIASAAKLQDIKETQKEFQEVYAEEEASILEPEEESKYPDFKTYIIYTNPNYRLQVGNYRTRLEAYHDLMLIRQEFSQAFISRGPIDLRTK